MSTQSSRRQYLISRLGNFAVAFAVLLVLTFVMPRLLPGSALTSFVRPGFSEQTRQQLMQQFGLNKPIWVQFYLYVVNTLTGNFGVSFSQYPTPVSVLIWQRLPRTLYLMAGSVSVSILLGVPLGAFAAWDFGERKDIVITHGSLLFRSIPTFWLALLLLFTFGYLIPIFPLSGVVTAGKDFTGPVDYFINLTWHSVLPMATLAAYFVAGYGFLMRASLLDVLPENYIKIAETKGLSDKEVLFKHAVPPAFSPVLTQLGFQIGRLIGGAVLVEAVFGYPGMGKLMFDAVLARDYPVIQATFFMLILTVLSAMFITDLLYSVLDPRVGES